MIKLALALSLFATGVALASPPTHCGAGRSALAIDASAKRTNADPVLALDPELKKFVNSTFPSGLDFDPTNRDVAARSNKRFQEWFTAEQKSAEQLAAKYAALVDGPNGPQRVAGSARLGQLTDQFAQTLLTAEIPLNVRRGEFAAEASQAFCDALTEQAQPLVESAVEKYKSCVALAANLGVSSAWSSWCQARVAALTPP